jgi:hypothetical protein
MTDAIADAAIAHARRDEVDRLRAINAALMTTLEAAVARVLQANHVEGDPILSDWVPDAIAAIAKARTR